MKIGILTLPLHTNYGGILQAYALQTVLERMGHEVLVIDRDREIRRSFLRQLLTKGKYFVCKYLLGKKIKYFNPKIENEKRREREQFTRRFINSYIDSILVRNLETDVPDDFDAIIVGSDQIWRYKYFTLLYNKRIENAYLAFTKGRNMKRIAYAASFGTDQWEYSPKETKKCACLLKQFNAVSVREDTGVTLCRNFLNREDVLHLIDPTLLLTKNDYIRLIHDDRYQKSSAELVCYILDNSETKTCLINKIARERNLTPVYTNSRIDDIDAPQNERIQPPVESWLRSFVDADFIVTDSFHACAFSIIFEKPFVVFANKERGTSRFTSLLKMFDLQRNMIFSLDDYDMTSDYSVPHDTKNKIEAYKSCSVDFLQKALL